MKTGYGILLMALAGLCLTSGSARAVISYDFAYTFDNSQGHGGNIVTGRLTGTPSGDYVTGVTVESLSINGHAVVGPFYTVHLEVVSLPSGDVGWTWIGDPVVSFHLENNNFMFMNTTDFSGDFFYLAQPGSTAYGSMDNPYTRIWDSAQGSWSLTAVPEPSTCLAGLFLLLHFGSQTVRRLRN